MAKLFEDTTATYDGKPRDVAQTTLPKDITVEYSTNPHQCNCKGGCKSGGKCCGKHHHHS